MNVCKSCSSFGKVIGRVHVPLPKKKVEIKKDIPTKKEIVDVVVQDYAERIKKARESQNLTQKEFAKKVNEKESLIHKIETGSFSPNVDLARKLEHALHIKLVEKFEEEKPILPHEKGTELTIGDFVKIRKR
jgi:putative transcription factor